MVPVFFWLAAPFISAYPEWVLKKTSSECPSETGSAPDISQPARKSHAQCENLISRRGQSGDIYGIIGSLFSGLALFGVAYTLMTDLSYRRRERKPILTCGFDEKEDVFLKNPSPKENQRTAAISAKLSVKVLNDAAVKSKIDVSLFIGGQKFSLTSLDIGLPMRDGDGTTVELYKLLDEGMMMKIATMFPNIPSLSLEFKNTCENLDGVVFSTTLKYRLALRFENQIGKMLWFGSKDPNNSNAWDDPTPISLAPTLEPESWSFTGGS